MAVSNIRVDYPRSRYLAFIHAGAISVAFVSGTFALAALLLGSPFEFGSALALSGTAWIVADIAERLAEQKHCRRGALPVQLHRRSPTRQRTLSTV